MRRFISRINGFCNQEWKLQQELVANSAFSAGWMDLAFFVYDSEKESNESLSSRYDGIIAGISAGDVVVLQLPTGNGPRWESGLMNRIRAYGGKVLVYAHSIEYVTSFFSNIIDEACYNNSALIVDSGTNCEELYKKAEKIKSHIFIREAANDYFDDSYYITKTLNLACESVLLGSKCQYYLMQNDREVDAESNAFTYFVARASYDGKTAISFQYKGHAELIEIKADGKVVWQSDCLECHYVLLNDGTDFSIDAFVFTRIGKLNIASTGSFQVTEPKFDKDKPKISLVVPMYNSSKYICRTIDSVLAQSQDGIELVLVDDESSDNTRDIVEWYCQRFESIVLIKKTNGGQGSARNAGIEWAHGKYITFMDHDDTLPPDAESILYHLIKETNTDIGIGSTKNMIAENRGIVIRHCWKEREVVDAKTYMSTNSPVMIWNKIYKAKLCKKVPFVPRYHEDISWSPIIFSYAKSISMTSSVVYEWDRTIVSQSINNLKKTEEWFTETYCIAVEDALKRGNPKEMPLVKKMIMSCEAFCYHPGLKEVVQEIVDKY